MMTHSFIRSSRNSYDIKGQNHNVIMYMLSVH